MNSAMKSLFPIFIILLSLALLIPGVTQPILSLSGTIDKAKLTDLFVVALIITFMAGNASGGMGEMLKTQAQFENGFYFFTAYCILSILSGFLVRRPTPIL